jgi:2-isopropylmalate synthase
MTALQATAERPTQKADERVTLSGLNYTGQKGGSFHARVNLQIGKRADSSAHTSRIGLIDAITVAVKNVIPHDAKLHSYSVHAITEGTDAIAEVTVVLKDHKGEYEGKATDSDTPTASATAYIKALNQLLMR